MSTAEVVLARLMISDPEAARERAARVLELDAKKRGTKRTRSAPRREKSEAKKATRRERMEEIRRVVIARQASVCAVCGFRDGGGDVHHVLSGVGQRRQHESAETCVYLCRLCHRFVTDNDLDALLTLAVYCTRNDMPEATRALSKRIAKIEESRRAR